MKKVSRQKSDQSYYFKATISIFLGLLLFIFLLPLNSSSAEIVSPEKFLGFQPGQDFKLANWKQITDYFQLLSQASNRIKLIELGKTTLGRPLVMAIISAEDNFSNLDRYKKYSSSSMTPDSLNWKKKLRS